MAAVDIITDRDSNKDQHLVIRQGDRYLAAAIWDIAEIIRMVEISPIPEASSHIAGALNYRGEIIPILNLWSLLDQPSPRVTPDMGIVIFSLGDQVFGVVIEEILGVFPLDARKRPDELAGDIVWPLISGVSYFEQANSLILILNPERLMRQQGKVAEELKEELQP